MRIIQRSILVATAATFFFSCGERNPESISLSSDKDSLSYFLGLVMGQNLRSAQISSDSLDSKLFMDGLRHAMDSTANFSAEDAMDYVQRSMSKKQETADNEFLQENKNFFAENGKKSGVVTTDSGLQYEVIESKGGAAISPTDSLLMSFKMQVYGKGQMQDSGSADSIMIAQERMFPGLLEGIKLMKVGDKYKFYIPYELGEDPNGQMFPKYTTVAYEVTIHSTKSARPAK
ncbi:MAG: FKBP-type peptidyl-prolyl cis-trans isomerase N-terminal domain-containing protein [Flavobacteriales bacterium]